MVVSAEVVLHCEGLRAILERDPRVEVVGMAAGPQATLAVVGRMRPDVLLLDATAVDRSWILGGVIAEQGVSVVTINSSLRGPQDVLALFEAGVRGFVGPDQSRVNLLETVHAVARGETRLPAQAIGTLLRQVAGRAAREEVTRSVCRLTARELDVFRLVDEGLSNKQIAANLHIEVATVKHHVHNILEKLRAARRGEAVAVGRRTGLLG